MHSPDRISNTVLDSPTDPCPWKLPDVLPCNCLPCPAPFFSCSSLLCPPCLGPCSFFALAPSVESPSQSDLRLHFLLRCLDLLCHVHRSRRVVVFSCLVNLTARVGYHFRFMIVVILFDLQTQEHLFPRPPWDNSPTRLCNDW